MCRGGMGLNTTPRLDQKYTDDNIGGSGGIRSGVDWPWRGANLKLRGEVAVGDDAWWHSWRARFNLNWVLWTLIKEEQIKEERGVVGGPRHWRSGLGRNWGLREGRGSWNGKLLQSGSIPELHPGSSMAPGSEIYHR